MYLTFNATGQWWFLGRQTQNNITMELLLVLVGMILSAKHPTGENVSKSSLFVNIFSPAWIKVQYLVVSLNFTNQDLSKWSRFSTEYKWQNTASWVTPICHFVLALKIVIRQSVANFAWWQWRIIEHTQNSHRFTMMDSLDAVGNFRRSIDKWYIPVYSIV